jgi:hypothetical protein
VVRSVLGMTTLSLRFRPSLRVSVTCIRRDSVVFRGAEADGNRRAGAGDRT